MNKVEIRVRPVVRHIVTRYEQERTSAHDEPPAYSASLATLGEFDSEGYAEIVAEALRDRLAPREYAIVQSTLGERMADVVYAYSEADVQTQLAHLAAVPDGEQPKTYRVFSRIRDMTIPS